MKKILLVLFAIISLGIAKAQVPTYYTMTLPASVSYTDSIRINGGQVPVALFSDSSIVSTAGAVAHITIYVGFTPTKNIGPTKWYAVNNVTDTVAYTTFVKAGYYIPLQETSILGLLGTYSSDSPFLWIKLRTDATQSYTKIIYLKTRYIE